MEHYTKGKNIEQEDCLPNDVKNALGDNFTWLKLTAGSPIGQQIPLAVNAINNTGEIVFSGSGAAVSKVVTVVEIVKRRLRGLHQLNRIFQKEVIEFWDPKLPELETLKVTRLIPAIIVVLSGHQVLESLPQTSTFLSRFLETDGMKKQRRPNTKIKKQSENNKENQVDQDPKKTPVKKRDNGPQDGRTFEKESLPTTKENRQNNRLKAGEGSHEEQPASDVKKRTRRRVRNRPDNQNEYSDLQTCQTKSDDLVKQQPEG